MRVHFSRRVSTWALAARLRTPSTEARAGTPSSVASLVAEAVGADAASDDALDWHRFGPEIATALLARQLPGSPGGEDVSEPLARSISNPELRAGLGLGASGA